ncbi:MAG: cobalt ECF transporter T component CbiQ [Candidatus Omnitrophica bacterium]|nr:cobalt ECF transporter T component CbiQ [Candidatus Omnitrophota bacterium]
MEHLFIDQYSGLDSIIHRLDPRTKIVTLIIFVIFIVLTPPTYFLQFLLYFVVIGGLILLSKVPFIFVFRRVLAVMPFVIVIGLFIPFIKEGEIAGAYSLGNIKLNVTYSGLIIFWNICIKAFLTVMCLTLLTSTTSFPFFLKGLEKLWVPGIFIMVLSFMYRYLFVSIDELMRMKHAKDSRTIKPKRLFEIKTLANMLGSLFIRSYERGESVYLAMCSRGFNGSIKTLDNSSFGYKDAIFSVGLTSILVLIRLTGIL